MRTAMQVVPEGNISSSHDDSSVGGAGAGVAALLDALPSLLPHVQASCTSALSLRLHLSGSAICMPGGGDDSVT